MNTQKILFKIRGTIYLIDPYQILFIKAEKSYCIIELSNGDSIRIAKNLKQVSSLFLETNFLYKVHRSFVVNLKFIEKIIPLEATKNLHIVCLTNGTTVPISNKQKSNFLSEFKNFSM